ncbi:MULTISPECIES: hypothetical protein [Paracoccus]|uniref:hypothetical protein n=1 Tax=Paracoccus TaxID=265 RepID=UPI000869450B|nr:MULTISPECIES: hypothetical protein [Paracoccus]ODT60963.1 MAG: hypothetical protein ABS73_03755 [Paracoccus sp. SCN 68-21]
MEDETDLVQQPTAEGAEAENVPENETALVKRILQTIHEDQSHHKEAFEKMREDMQLATHGRNKTWPEGHYTANIVGRHVKQKTAALYAKNPKVVARRRETLDFAVWDENPQSLMMAFQTIQMAQQMMAGMSEMPIDPLTGQPVMPEIPGFAEAQELIGDFTQGQQRRDMLTKLGKTLQVLFNHAMREQKPLDFKMGMKKLVRRTCTTGVGYVKLAFVRELGAPPVTQDRMTDIRNRIAHLERLSQEVAEGEIEDIAAETRELQLSLEAIQNEELVVVKEGLIFDYPQATRVIPDKNTTSLVGFVSARHLTVEYLFTANEVKEQFEGAEIDDGFTPYRADWVEDEAAPRAQQSTDSKGQRRDGKTKGMVRVYEHFDKATGLVYYVADGHSKFLRSPAPPEVFVEDFWPVYALTFNEVENEKELFPPSDARLMLHQQAELNRSRQGQREHRQAARPRFVIKTGAMDEKDYGRLGSAEPFDVIPLNLTMDQSVNDALEAISIPGVDPNLYETGPFFQDMQLVVGSQQATMGGISKATATEAAIAESSMAASDGSSVDDLDNFLTMVARASGQILLREMSPERVTQIVGPGALWPEMTLDEIADQLFLEIEAGSTGKPNQASEMHNMQTLMPFLMQMPNIDPMWLAREVLRRMDDRLDLTEAVVAGLPSIAAMNQMAPQNAIATDDPAAAPGAQGGQGADNAPAGPSETPPGSSASFGSNQV